MELREVAIDEIDMHFERFRVVDPRMDARILDSMRTYGQLCPVLAGTIEKKVLLVDGYKRLRAAKVLQRKTLRVYTVERSITALKAISLTINQEPSPCRELEEALIVQSLHRDDGLQQNEIAILCNRHKSWVCRRIALIERLSEEVGKQIGLGLLTKSAARELLRLPRGNQQEVAQSVLEHHLSSRQSRLLIEAYMNIPQWQREKLLNDPFSSIAPEQGRLNCGIFTALTRALIRDSQRLATIVQEKGIGSLRIEQRLELRRSLERVGARCSSLIEMVKTGVEV